MEQHQGGGQWHAADAVCLDAPRDGCGGRRCRRCGESLRQGTPGAEMTPGVTASGVNCVENPLGDTQRRHAIDSRRHRVINPNTRKFVAMHYRNRIRGWLVIAAIASSGTTAGQDISDFDQHFNAPGKDIAPWMFVPQDNIKEFSTQEHPGLATIYEAGKGKDIKGILKDPIKIGQYRLPWEFQTSLVQSFNLTAGVGVKTQVNSAIGLNVAVTFSDPATWPADRTQRPRQTHEFQLLVVHLGSTGEAGVGLPQFSTEPHPETYLVWGRGDLGHTAMGDWRIPYVWIGDGAKYAGPASPQLYFRCVLLSPTQLQVGIKFDAAHGWNMRTIDC